jgi:hypothetical protein
MISPYLVAPGLRFNDCLFTEPVQLAHWVPPNGAGIVAILARNTNWAPKPFQVIYFGEFGNDARRSLESREMRFHAPGGNLYVSVLALPFSSSAQRIALRNELISAYNPACQATETASPADLARRMDVVEARQHEHHTQILSLLVHLCKLFEPQPVGPHRPIGFLPALARAEGDSPSTTASY